MPFAISLACRKLKLTPAEAIAAATWNPACLLGVEDQVGSIEPGKRADLQLLDCVDERELAFEVATPGPLVVILDGKIVHTRAIELEDPELPDDEADDAEGLDGLGYDEEDDDEQ
jgi:imidazolonepropionase-like amidohydrolase